MDQFVNPYIELSERYSCGVVDKGLFIGMQKGISINNICKGSYVVTTQFLQYKFMCHFNFFQQRPGRVMSFISVEIAIRLITSREFYKMNGIIKALLV